MSEEDQDEHLGEMTLKPMRSSMSADFVAHCQEYHLDPHMPCFRAMVSGDLMLKLKAARPDVGNIMHILVGPYGIVTVQGQSFRVAELQVEDTVIDVEAEYDQP
jgi:hypothetical protein